jgi:hypothetical protein
LVIFGVLEQFLKVEKTGDESRNCNGDTPPFIFLKVVFFLTVRFFGPKNRPLKTFNRHSFFFEKKVEKTGDESRNRNGDTSPFIFLKVVFFLTVKKLRDFFYAISRNKKKLKKQVTSSEIATVIRFCTTF